MAIILDGKKLSAQIQEELKETISQINLRGEKIPHLAAILIGNDGASETYIKSKIKFCEKIGMQSTSLNYESNITEEKLLKCISSINKYDDIDGLIVQLPLPKHINENKIIEHILPSKDVDGFHPVNLGRMQLGLPAFVSATPAGIITLLERYNIDTKGKHCIVIGRSNIVGTPISILLSRNASPGNCTVTLCHSKTVDLKNITQQADIVIAALGIPEFLTADKIKEGAVIIDVGITRVAADNTKGYVIKGDVKFDEVSEKCSAITPVPGGVGLMTVVSLLMNTIKAAQHSVYPVSN